MECRKYRLYAAIEITVDLHAQVKEIAAQAKQPISKVACQLVEFALNHVIIKDGGDK